MKSIFEDDVKRQFHYASRRPLKNFRMAAATVGGQLRTIITRAALTRALMPPTSTTFLSILTIRNVSRVVILEKSVEEMLAARFWFQVKEGD